MRNTHPTLMETVRSLDTVSLGESASLSDVLTKDCFDHSALMDMPRPHLDFTLYPIQEIGDFKYICKHANKLRGEG